MGKVFSVAYEINLSRSFRSNPQVNVGAVDLSCAVVVVDARRYDLPMYIYASIRKAGRLLDSGSWWMNLLLSSSASQASGDWISEKVHGQ